MATIRNLIVRISVSENTDKGIRKVTDGLRETNRELDKADKGSNRFGGTLSNLGRTSLTGLTGGLAKVAAFTKTSAIGLGAVAAGAASLNTVVGAGTALAPLAGALLLLPGAALGAATALGTLHLATSGMSDAFKYAMGNGPNDPKKFAAALKQLAPAARGVAVELHNLKPQLEGIKNSAQQALFKPLTGQLTAMAKVLVGPLSNGVAQVANQFGLAGRQVALFARDATTVAVLRATFINVAVAIRQLTPALQPVLTGFRNLAALGLSFLPQIATSVGNLATKFGLWLQQIIATGQAQQWIQNALATFKQLFGIIGQVGGILKSVFSAASAAGSGFLGVIGAALAQLNAFLKTAAGKSALQSIFQGLAAIGQTLGPVIGALVQGLGVLANPIGMLAEMIGPILTTAIKALAPALAALAPGLQAIFTGLSTAVTALGPALLPLGQALAQIGIALGPVLPIVAQAIVGLAPLLPLAAQLAALLAQQLSGALRELIAVLGPVISAIASSLVPIIPQITAAFSQWAAAVLPVATLLGQQLGGALKQILPQLLAMIPQLLQGLIPAMIQLLIAVTPLIPQLVQLGVVLAQNLVSALPQLIPPLIQLITLMTQWTPIMVPVLSMILQISTALSGALGGGVTDAVRVIAWGLGQIVGLFQWLYNVLLGHSIIPDIVNGTVAWFGSLPGRVIGFFASMASSAVGKVGDMLRSLSGIPGWISGIFSGAGSWLYNAGRSIINGLINGISSAVGALRNLLSRVTSWIPSWKGPMSTDLRLLHPSGAAIMTGLVAGIGSGVPGLRAALGGVTDTISAGVAPSWASPAGVTAMAGAGAAGGSGGTPDAGTLAAAIKQALVGVGVHMDSQPVGQIVSQTLGRSTDQRRRTG